jgi:hypothetical protein
MAYELLDFNIKVCTVQFGNTATNFQKNVTKSDPTAIPSYAALMDKISAILIKKSDKNTNLTADITHKLLNIAENPSKNFRRHTIGFDAKLMRYLRAFLGYRCFNSIIRRFVLK